MASQWMTRPTGLFQGGSQVENFREMATIYPARVVRRASKAAPFEAGEPLELPAAFEFEGRTLDTAQFLSEMETTGLLVLRDGRLVFERYWLGNDATTQSASWSVGKSFVSALVGVAVDEGAIRSVEEPVSLYAPMLKGGAYEGVRLKDVLQMSSGARWNEDYSDPNSDIGAYGRVMASRYNTRALPAEVLVHGSAFELVTARETFDQMIAGEKVPAFLK